MIRLTLNTKSDPEIHLFTKTEIFLGKDPASSDLIIPNETIEPIHFKLSQIDGLWILFNLTHDSFASINGHPFEKKLLNSGDIIEVNGTVILFENLPNESLPLPSLSDESKKTTSSLKDGYLSHLDDDNQTEKKNTLFEGNSEPSHLMLAWRSILIFMFAIFSICGLVGSVFYFNATDRSEAHEIKATQGIADVAMALTKARLKQEKPPHQNWSDVDFLKNHLQDVLPATFSNASQIDAQGQFNCCPYHLRIYTNSDLSHFLLIAQPAPTIFYWLIPKPIIVVDSELMELRTLKDVKTLNRLLSVPEALEGFNGKEITALVREGALIRLSLLANESKHLDFAPPKELSQFKAGAENLIYNAPRYFHLGDSIVQKTIFLSSSKGNSQDVKLLKEEAELLSSLQNYILYTDRGKNSALMIKKGLSFFSPKSDFFFGYFEIDANGKINTPQLLNIDEDTSKLAVAYEKRKNNQLEEIKKLNHGEIDLNHPIYIKLQSLMKERSNLLTPQAEQICELIEKEQLFPSSNFKESIDAQFKAFLKIDEEANEQLKHSIDTLFTEYSELPIEDFIKILSYLHLDELTHFPIDQPPEKMENLISQIKDAHNFIELKSIIEKIELQLNFHSTINSKDLLSSSHQLRNQVLDQIEYFLFLNPSMLSFTREEKMALTKILTHERCIRCNEKDYFMEEYEKIGSS